MEIKRLMVAAAVLALGASAMGQQVVRPPAKKAADPVPPAKVPDKLQPFVELSQKAAEYEKQITINQWREVWKQTFDAADSIKWLPAAPAAEADANLPARRIAMRNTVPAVSAEKVDDRECAVLDASELQNAYYPLGSGNLRGEFAIEFVGKAMSDRPCDLSISCLSSSTPVIAFEFGAHWNQANFLRYVPNDGRATHRQPLLNTPLIEQGKWHKVRLEVRDGKTSCTLDGKELGSFPCKVDEKPYTPNIYIFQSKIAVDEVKVEAMAPSASNVDPAVAFKKAFGDKSRDEVMKQVAELVEALDDPDSRVREAAHQLLKPMGTITRDALQAAVQTGSAEQVGRAEMLLEVLPPPTTQPAAR